MSVLYGWAKTGLKIANKLWEGFCFENWGLGKVCLSHNSSLDCISRQIITDPPFLHRRDNNDCRLLHRTWRTLCMNKHLINKAVGRTQKTSFPLAASPKLSSAPISKQIPVLAPANPGNQHPSFYSESLRNLFITRGTEYREWLVENITWQLASKFSQWELTVAGRSG